MNVREVRKYVEFLRGQEAEAERHLAVAQRRYEAAHDARESGERFLAVMDDAPIVLDDDLPTSLDDPRWSPPAKARPRTTSKRPPRREAIPRGSDALERVFKDTPGHVWTVRSLLGELERRGWTPRSDKPLSAVRSNLARTLDLMGDQIERRVTEAGHHEFVYHPPTDSSSNGQGTAGVGIASATLAVDRTSQEVPS